MKALVTGGTGFLGGHIVAQLVDAGWDVTCLHRTSSDTRTLRALDVRLHEGGLHDLESLRAGTAGQDVVFHAAANTTIWRRRENEQLHDNIDGTGNVARAALAAGARLVHISSVSAYDLHEGTLNEQTPMRGRDSWVPYCRSKHIAEDEVRSAIVSGLQAVIVNPAHIMGPGDPGTWSRMIRMVHDGTLPGVPGGAGSFCDVRHVAASAIAAADRGQVGENYILGGENRTFLQVVQAIGEVLGRKVPNKPLSDWLLRAVARYRDLVSRVTGKEPDLTPEGIHHVLARFEVDDTKAQQVLGHRHTDLGVLIRDTTEWMRHEGLLRD